MVLALVDGLCNHDTIFLHPEFNLAQQLVNKKQSVLQPRDVVSEVATGKQFAGWLKTAAARHLHQVVYVCFTLFV